MYRLKLKKGRDIWDQNYHRDFGLANEQSSNNHPEHPIKPISNHTEHPSNHITGQPPTTPDHGVLNHLKRAYAQIFVQEICIQMQIYSQTNHDSLITFILKCILHLQKNLRTETTHMLKITYSLWPYNYVKMKFYIWIFHFKMHFII